MKFANTVLILSLAATQTALAAVDSFSDGDYSANPSWTVSDVGGSQFVSAIVQADNSLDGKSLKLTVNSQANWANGIFLKTASTQPSGRVTCLFHMYNRNAIERGSEWWLEDAAGNMIVGMAAYSWGTADPVPLVLYIENGVSKLNRSHTLPQTGWHLFKVDYDPAASTATYSVFGPSGDLLYTYPDVHVLASQITKCVLHATAGERSYQEYFFDNVTFSTEDGGGGPLAITIQSSRQRSDGTGRIEIRYDLRSPWSLHADVSATFSSNGGATWNVIPQTGSLTGDYGNGIAPGSHVITWAASQQLPANTFNGNFYARLVATAAGTSVTNIVGPFTVDLSGLQGGLTVKGRVLDGASRAALSGATVTLAGQSTSSSASGQFSFGSVSLNSGNTLAVSKSGYATYTGTVPVPAGSTTVTLPDILLEAAPVGSKPVVTRVEPRLKGLFLSGVTLNNDFTASVNWNGATPGTVRFFVNDSLVQEVNGPGPEYSASIDMAHAAFQPALNASANRIRVTAVSASDVSSEPAFAYVGILPLPEALRYVTLESGPFSVSLDGHIGLDFDFPDPSLKQVVQLPVVGKFGFELAANASFDYTVTDGDWEAAFGVGAEGKQGKRGRRPTIPALTRYPKLKLYIGNKEISGKLEGGGRGTATLTSGITFDEVFVRAELGAKLELGRVGVPDLFGPGLSTLLGGIPGLSDALKPVSVIIYFMPGVEGEGNFALQPVFAFKNFELTGKAGLEASYEPNLGLASMRLYIGGEPSFTIQVPGELLKELRFRAYAGAEFQTWIFRLGPFEYVFVDCSYSPQTGLDCGGGAKSVAMFRVVSADGATLRPVSRQYLLAGPEGFVGYEGAPGQFKTMLKGSGITPLEAFRTIGREGGGGLTPKDAPGGAGSSVSQADLTICTNLFNASQPAMAGRSNELMLLYVTDNGSPNNLQFTDINWTRFDGTNWSVPTTIQTNTQAEFSPQVAYDGNGDAIAVWERVADPNFNQTNLTAMAEQMEIVWARWSRTNRAWSEPVALTTNSYLDHAPLLCGPMANGDVLLLWTRNYANQLMGSGPVGADENDRVMWTKWSAATKTWNTPVGLIPYLPYRLSQSLAGVSNHAVYAWTRDLDGVLTNAADQQVFYCAWNNGVWGAVTQFTADNAGNRNARVSIGPDGHNYLVWQSGTNLVLSRDFSTNSTLVRADSQTAGFADYAMTIGPAGNLALLWQEMSQAGSDAHYSVLDPASATWSKDEQLFNDPPLERSFAPVWDDVGNLTVAYNKVEIIYTNKTVTLEGGGTVTITNVPQPGRVDLCVTKRQLIKDVALAAGDFTVDAENYLPGAAVTLSATLRNAGDVAVSNAVVAFYDGNPTNGGVLITNIAISGWLEGAATNTVSALWVVPEPATNHVLYAVADPANAITEFDEANNTQSLSIGGTDLAVSLVSQTAETNGAVRVIAQVQNLGAPSATNSTLTIRRYGNTNAPLATVAVPLLEPGRLAQVALDLPAGTQPEGEQVYTLTADETHVTSDVDTNNNTSSFAVNLWIDSDGDGIPDSWMMHYFGHATGQAGDLSRAQDDADGDGMNNLAEYRAGTSPADPLSYLRMTRVGLDGTNGVLVAWGSATNKLYTVQRSSNLAQAFTNLVEHILSTPPENVFLDPTATNGAAQFYRVKLE